MRPNMPHIEFGVSGPSGEDGVLLIAPRDEAMEWDLKHEIASTSRHWVREKEAWWIAAAYVPTLHDIVLRFGGEVDPLAVEAAGPPTPPVVEREPESAPESAPDAPRSWRRVIASAVERVVAAISRPSPPRRAPRILPTDPRKA